MRRLGIVAAVVLVLVVGVVWWSSARGSRIGEAVGRCEEISGGLPDTVVVDSDSVTVAVEPDDGESFVAAACLLAALDAPDAYAARIEVDGATGGEGSADHDGLSYSWTSTSRGLVLTVVD